MPDEHDGMLIQIPLDAYNALVKACAEIDELGAMDEDVAVIMRLTKFVNCVMSARTALELAGVEVKDA